MAVSLKRFRRMVLLTLLLTLLLIFVGGFVRATGSGLGCPDWPRCWGCWWPPSTLEKVDLPAVLEEFREKHPELTEDDLVALFNPAHLWIEYLNRLLGVVVGLSIFVTLLVSLRIRRDHPWLFRGTFAAFLLVGFQGWLGGVVVKSKLMPGMITLHLVCAILLFCLLIAIAMGACSRWPSLALPSGHHRRVRNCVLLFFLLSAIQVVLGAQAREAIDHVVHEDPQLPRGSWIEAAGSAFKLHRSFAWSLVAVSAWTALCIVQSRIRGWRFWVPMVAVGMVALQVLTGWTLSHYGLPPGSQVIHLGIGCSMVCVGFFLLLASGRESPLIAGAGSN